MTVAVRVCPLGKLKLFSVSRLRERSGRGRATICLIAVAAARSRPKAAASRTGTHHCRRRQDAKPRTMRKRMPDVELAAKVTKLKNVSCPSVRISGTRLRTR